MNCYKVEIGPKNTLLIGFTGQTTNDNLVREATTKVDALIESKDLAGGKIIGLNGPASLPVAVVLSHKLTHLYGAVAVFDPKMGKYVVAVSHDPDFAVGDLLSPEELASY